MIVKIKTYKRPTFRFLLNYIMEERKRQSPDGKSFVITHNVKGKSIDGWVNQFKQNEKLRLRKRRKDGVYFNHEILSWHRDDTKHLTQEKLQDMVRHYFRLRGSHFMGVATVHTDRDHVHVHICSSGLQYRTGKSMRMSRKEYADLKKNMQAYHVKKFPELTHSVVNHGRKNKVLTTDREIQYKRRTGKQTKKEELLSMLDDCQKHSKTPEEFFARLKGCKLQTYVRGGKVYGVVFGNRKYRFKRFGIDVENFQAKEIRRGKELRNARKRKGKNPDRNIEH